MTPDYTYGHTVTKSMQDNTAADGWTTVTNQVSPLGAPDFSSYLLNVANSGADILVQDVNWGHDAGSVAKQFGVLDKMKLVVPYQVPFLARETGGLMQASMLHRLLVDVGGQVPARQDVQRRVREKNGYKPEWGAENATLASCTGPHGRGSRQLLSGRMSSRSTRRKKPFRRWSAMCYYRKEDHQCVRPVIIVKGKQQKDMKGKEDYYDIVEIVPGKGLMQKPDAFGCKLGDYT